MGARNYKPSKSEKKIYKAVPAQASSFQSEEQQIKCKKFCGEKREIEWTGNRCQGWNTGQSKSLEDLNSERQIKLKGGNLRKKSKFKLGCEWERYDDLQVTSTRDTDRGIVFRRLVLFKSCNGLEMFFFLPHMLHDDYCICTSFSIPTKPYYQGRTFLIASSVHALTSIILARKHNCQNQFASYFSKIVVTIETSY